MLCGHCLEFSVATDARRLKQRRGTGPKRHLRLQKPKPFWTKRPIRSEIKIVHTTWTTAYHKPVYDAYDTDIPDRVG